VERGGDEDRDAVLLRLGGLFVEDDIEGLQWWLSLEFASGNVRGSDGTETKGCVGSP